MRAVKLLETYMDFQGRKVLEDQPLAFPRDWVYGTDRCQAFPTTLIPPVVQEAQVLMAIALSEGFEQEDAASSPINQIRVSTIRIDFASARSARGAMVMPSEVVEKLRGYAEYVGVSGMARSVPIER